MDYRTPTAGLERRLGDLEEELARLHGLPPLAAGRKGPPTKSPRERALERRLAKLECELAKAGYRALTEREASHLAYLTNLGVAIATSGLLIASAHLVLRSAPMIWTETTCKIFAEEEDVYVARYASHGKEWKFSARGEGSRSEVRCWVPDPPASGVGLLAPPRTPRVPLSEKVSWSWLLSAAGAVLAGVFFIFGGRWEAENRRKSLIAPDEFSSSD